MESLGGECRRMPISSLNMLSYIVFPPELWLAVARGHSFNLLGELNNDPSTECINWGGLAFWS
jgi:hypothetical protein